MENSNKTKCWCMALPVFTKEIAESFTKAGILDRVESSEGIINTCLCSTCFKKVFAEKLNTLLGTLSIKSLIQLAKPYKDEKTFIEYIDYTTENGYCVFSAWYHLKRGTCCNNNCRHCPYKNK